MSISTPPPTTSSSSLPGTPTYNWDFTSSTIDSVNGLDIAPGASVNATDGLVFNGSTNYTLINQNINLGSNNAFSIYFEFKYNTYTSHTTLMTFGTAINGGFGSTDNGLIIKGSGSTPDFFCRPQLKYNGNINGVIKSQTINENTYYKVVITTNGTQSKLYIDGSLINTGATAGFVSGTRTGIHLGGHYGKTDRNLNGSIRSIIMWDTELSEAAVAQLNGVIPDNGQQETWIPVIQNLNKTAFANASAVTSGSGSIDTNLYSMGSSAFNSGGYNSSGRYLFRLVYGNDVNSPAYDFQWYQTTNPWEVNTSQVGAIEYPVGFSAPPSSDGRSFVGLGISSSINATLLDGDADNTWWYAVGIINHDLGNPGPNKTWYNNLTWYVWG